MAERPTHALIVRPALVEAPLWLVWRLAHVARAVLDALSTRAAARLDHYRDAPPEQRRLALATAVTAVLFLGLAVSTVSILV
ncbi:hypothetical protein [Amycolatopsis sp. CA-230715]|uniref:hypothetical protein n=1 Tax=Amycolatopsis sp. CA-230715 TaxID=2745196 RepID=UPI001C014113|nr:hypothetical protein [Amycolatopsis sp. CA-230715]QWF78746.1 hypothetical protein HUW46_02144 [Amycolatopsis sp. CA-230715]